MEWQSNYIDSHIDIWRGFLGENYTPDAYKTARVQIYENIAYDFLDSFPIAVMFIPASRAISSIADSISTKDKLLSNFFEFDKQFVMEFNDVSDTHTNKILHLKNIKVNQEPNTKEKTMTFITRGGREVTSLELSSGQQELIILLLLMKDLPGTTFYYGKGTSVFIEEPCAHLFPQEQKDSIEYFVKIFRELKDVKKNNVRYFITTHSPYVLNVINNMLRKGSIIKKYPEQVKKINDTIEFQSLFTEELSAIFINEDETITDMLDYNEEQIFPDKIQNISFSIYNDMNKLDDLYTELSKTKEKD
jgi:predicted ATPase